MEDGQGEDVGRVEDRADERVHDQRGQHLAVDEPRPLRADRVGEHTDRGGAEELGAAGELRRNGGGRGDEVGGRDDAHGGSAGHDQIIHSHWAKELKKKVCNWLKSVACLKLW